MSDLCGLDACDMAGTCQARTPCPEDARYVCANCGDNVWSVNASTGERNCIGCKQRADERAIRWPTAEEFIDELNARPRDEQIEYAARVIAELQYAQACRFGLHD